MAVVSAALALVVIAVGALLFAKGGWFIHPSEHRLDSLPKQPILGPSAAVSLPAEQDRMGDWKTYTETVDSHRFTIKYPARWALIRWARDNTVFIDFGDPSTKTWAGVLYPSIRLQLTTRPDIAALGIDQFIRNEGLLRPRALSVLNVKGMKATAIFHEGCQSGMCLDVFLKYDNTIIDLGIPEQAEPDELTDQKSLLRVMLSTLEISNR